jgi:hypothetical protein
MEMLRPPAEKPRDELERKKTGVGEAGTGVRVGEAIDSGVRVGSGVDEEITLVAEGVEIFSGRVGVEIASFRVGVEIIMIEVGEKIISATVDVGAFRVRVGAAYSAVCFFCEAWFWMTLNNRSAPQASAHRRDRPATGQIMTGMRVGAFTGCVTGLGAGWISSV